MVNKIVLLLSKYKLYIIILLNVIVFALLLYKDPFSDRTLIPNFEPYPDTMHYINPARSFLIGKGLKIFRNGYGRNPSVPPLYSLVLIPIYVINRDARMFYFTNIILALISYLLFYKILRKITNNIFIIGFCLFLYITNYFLYWYPTLAMAENLVLPLFLLAIYLLSKPISIWNSLITGFITISFYATKYASAPLVVTFIFLHFIKIILITKIKIKKKITYLLFLTLGSTVTLLTFFDISKVMKSVYTNLFLVLSPITTNLFRSPSITATNFDNAPFSKYYFDKYFPQYIKAILGNPARFLWDNTPIVPKFVGMTGLIGLVLSLFRKKSWLLGLSLMATLSASIYFIANFYSFDMRFIYQAIPIMLLGFALFLSFIDSLLKKDRYKKLFNLIVMGLFLFYFLNNAIRFKKQIMLNIKYKETPWYYVAVVEVNKYFNKPNLFKRPILISALIPYYIDFFSNGNYNILPLSQSQDFFGEAKLAWGPNDYSDLIALYKSYINKGYEVYVHNSGLGNVGLLHVSYSDVKKNFRLEKVADGCYDSCNIYKLSLPD